MQQQIQTYRLRKLKSTVASVAFGVFLMSNLAYAAPTGGVINAGSGSITQSGATTTITQNSGLIDINWNTFNVGAAETVHFDQVNNQAIAINRIQDASPSIIDGTILANGRVFLINDAGITFGSTAQVNVGSLVATTSDNDSFSGDDFHFIGGDNGATISNEGTISIADGGFAILSAPKVENTGSITAQDGTIGLGSATEFTINTLSNNISFEANTATVGAIGADIAGTLSAQGGYVVIDARRTVNISSSVINLDGDIDVSAHGMSPNGTIDISADNFNMNVGGSMDGGDITISAEKDIVFWDDLTLTPLGANLTLNSTNGYVSTRYSSSPSTYNGSTDGPKITLNDGNLDASGRSIALYADVGDGLIDLQSPLSGVSGVYGNYTTTHSGNTEAAINVVAKQTNFEFFVPNGRVDILTNYARTNGYSYTYGISRYLNLTNTAAGRLRVDFRNRDAVERTVDFTLNNIGTSFIAYYSSGDINIDTINLNMMNAIDVKDSQSLMFAGPYYSSERFKSLNFTQPITGSNAGVFLAADNLTFTDDANITLTGNSSLTLYSPNISMTANNVFDVGQGGIRLQGGGSIGLLTTAKTSTFTDDTIPTPNYFGCSSCAIFAQGAFTDANGAENTNFNAPNSIIGLYSLTQPINDTLLFNTLAITSNLMSNYKHLAFAGDTIFYTPGLRGNSTGLVSIAGNARFHSKNTSNYFDTNIHADGDITFSGSGLFDMGSSNREYSLIADYDNNGSGGIYMGVDTTLSSSQFGLRLQASEDIVLSSVIIDPKSNYGNSPTRPGGLIIDTDGIVRSAAVADGVYNIVYDSNLNRYFDFEVQNVASFGTENNPIRINLTNYYDPNANEANFDFSLANDVFVKLNNNRINWLSFNSSDADLGITFENGVAFNNVINKLNGSISIATLFGDLETTRFLTSANNQINLSAENNLNIANTSLIGASAVNLNANNGNITNQGSILSADGNITAHAAQNIILDTTSTTRAEKISLQAANNIEFTNITANATTADALTLASNSLSSATNALLDVANGGLILQGQSTAPALRTNAKNITFNNTSADFVLDMLAADFTFGASNLTGIVDINFDDGEPLAYTSELYKNGRDNITRLDESNDDILINEKSIYKEDRSKFQDKIVDTVNQVLPKKQVSSAEKSAQNPVFNCSGSSCQLNLKSEAAVAKNDVNTVKLGSIEIVLDDALTSTETQTEAVTVKNDAVVSLEAEATSEADSSALSDSTDGFDTAEAEDEEQLLKANKKQKADVSRVSQAQKDLLINLLPDRVLNLKNLQAMLTRF